MASQDLITRSQIAIGVDTAIVVAFVAIGRRNHHEDSAVAGLVETAAPFLISLAVSWIVWRVWNDPTSKMTGLRVWLTTVALGMVLRRFVFDDGTATSFVIVTAGFLGVFLIGWRATADALIRRSSAVS